MAEYDISKLPRWAQDEIRALHSRCLELEAAVQTYYKDAGPITWSSNNDTRALPERSTVHMQLAGGSVYMHLHDGALRIFGNITGHKRFVVVPQAANHVEIRFMED